MTTSNALPRRGTRIQTPEGEWEVRDVMVLGRDPLHFAVRVDCPAGAGQRLSIVLSRSEYQTLLARAAAPAAGGARGSRPGKLTPRR